MISTASMAPSTPLHPINNRRPRHLNFFIPLKKENLSLWNLIIDSFAPAKR